MARYIETKLRYEKKNENGAIKKVNESYLVDALTFTEAEAKIIERMASFISGDFSVSAVKKTKIEEIINKDSDKFYLVRFALMTIDEKTATEKKKIIEILVGASNFHEAVKLFEFGMKGNVSDYEIVSINESSIIDIL